MTPAPCSLPRWAMTIAAVLASVGTLVLAGTFYVFGPETFKPTLGAKKAQIFNRSFSAPVVPSTTVWTLHLVNGGSGLTRVSSCGVTINGKVIVRPSDINQNVGTLDKTVTLTTSNTMQLQVAGNSGSGVTVSIGGTDNTAPTITATTTPAPNAAGWNNTNVTVTFTCQDTISGIASCTAPVTRTTDGAGQTVTGTAVDKAGNTATRTVTLNIDKQPPTVTANPAPAPNGAGWNKTDVTVSFTCQDQPALSGIATCPASSMLTAETAGQAVSGTATDRAGNAATASVSVKIDKTLPTISAAASPSPNANGWNSTDVTVSFVVADALSGVAGSVPPMTVMMEGANQSISGSVTDRADNTASAAVTVSLDKTPPTLTITAPTGTITNNAAPDVAVSYSDATSQIDQATLDVRLDGTPLSGCVVSTTSATCQSPTLVSGIHTTTALVSDLAGNSQTTSQDFNLQLATPLDIQITSPATGYLSNANNIQVTGTVSTQAESVVVNGIVATRAGGNFTAPAVPLVEGNNRITAVAMNSTGGVGSSTVVVVRDMTPPSLAIEYPTEGQVLTAAAVTIIGLVNDVTTGTVDAQNCHITASGRAGSADATINNRTFMIEQVPLVPGPNEVTVTATDTAGNLGIPVTLHVVRQDLAGQKITALSDSSQAGVINTVLANPLVAVLTSATGAPVAGRAVTFNVTRGDGVLSTPDETDRSVTVLSDSSGQARVTFTLGTRSGVGNQRVSATAIGFVGEASFVVTALNGPPTAIKTYTGDSQFAAVGKPLPNPFVVFVHDHGGNPVPDVPVTFEVTKGGGNIDGQASVEVPTDADGRAKVVLTLGAEPGTGNNRLEARIPGLTGRPAVLTASALAIGPASATRVSGLVLDNTDRPVPAATIRIINTGLTTETDETGRFSIAGAPVGNIKLEVNATTTTLPGQWPMLMFVLTTVSGQDNTIGMPIFVVALDAAHAKMAGGDQDVTLEMTNVTGAQLTVFAHSVTCPDGSSQCPIMISQVHNDKVPMPPLAGQNPPMVWTIQPMGARFNPPARISFPNIDGLQPGRVVEISSFDHDLGQYVSVGTATVSEDGMTINSDPGSGIIHAGWHYPWCNPRPTTCGAVPCSLGGENKEQVDCKVPIAGDPCSFLGCLMINAPDGIPCGTNIPEGGKCGYCISGNCLTHPVLGEVINNCGAYQNSLAYYQCRIAGVFQKYQIIPVPYTSVNHDKHSGQKDEISGCRGDDINNADETEETCRLVSHSWHYCDRAFDIHSNDLCPELLDGLIEDLSNIDGVSVVGTEPAYRDKVTRKLKARGGGEHLHIEWGLRGMQCRQGSICTIGRDCNVCDWIPVASPDQLDPFACANNYFNDSLQQLICSVSCP